MNRSINNYYAESNRVYRLHETDVLMGRGKSIRPANVRFHHVIWELKEEYEKAKVGTKFLVVEKAIDKMCFELKPPSRFVEKRCDGNLYMVPRERILQKTKRAFTDLVNGRVNGPPMPYDAEKLAINKSYSRLSNESSGEVEKKNETKHSINHEEERIKKHQCNLQKQSELLHQNFKEKEKNQEYQDCYRDQQQLKLQQRDSLDRPDQQEKPAHQQTRYDSLQGGQINQQSTHSTSQGSYHVDVEQQGIKIETLSSIIEKEYQSCSRQEQQHEIHRNEPRGRRDQQKQTFPQQMQYSQEDPRPEGQISRQQHESSGNQPMFCMTVRPRRSASFDLEQRGIKFETLSSVIDTVLKSEL